MKTSDTPIIDELYNYKKKKITYYDVPGHKKNIYNNDLTKLFGVNIYKYDYNASINLDSIISNEGVINDSLKLISKTYKSDNSLYLINGSSSGIHIMIMATCKNNEKIILPRNIHQSVINALIFSGAIPIFINPSINQDFEIPNPIQQMDYIKTILNNPDSKAVFIIYPTYYGSFIDINPIIKLAHRMNMIVLVDQAHGAHFSFHSMLPVSSVLLGADIIVLSTHKTNGSLTQSSLLLYNENHLISFYDLKRIYLMYSTTSASYILLSSLEASRKYIDINAKDIYNKLIPECINLKIMLNSLPYLKVLGVNNYNLNNELYDPTKIVINVSNLGYTGFEVYKIMFEKYNIHLELGEKNIVLAIIGIGDTKNTIRKLYYSFKKFIHTIKLNINILENKIMFNNKKNYSIMKLSPRDAFYKSKKKIKIIESLGYIAGETIILYPPGIPICIIGEQISKYIISILLYYNLLYPHVKIKKEIEDKEIIMVIN